MRPLSIMLVFLLTLAGRAETPANEYDPPSLSIEPISTNVFNGPVGIYHAGDGSSRLFIVERPGRILVFRQGKLEATAYLDVTDRVYYGGEGGLLGLAFPPRFTEKRHLYINYTRLTDNTKVVSRLTLGDDDRPNPATEEILLSTPGRGAHNGGQIAFGPDGFLYIAIGDGYTPADPSNPAQDPTSLLGKILRIDVESGATPYAIPGTNPFRTRSGWAPEIWALGLRNPWRFSFDRVTGDLFIGDVGEVGMEELDFQKANSSGGENYGWPYFEGIYNRIATTNSDLSQMTAPIVAWHRVDLQMASVIGGIVCRNPNAGRLNGFYFVGDYVRGSVWLVKRVGSEWRKSFAGSIAFPATFGEDEQGSVYCTDTRTSMIYRFRDTFEAYPPSFNPPSGTFETDQQVTLQSDTPATMIAYTTDGRDPTESDVAVPNGGTVLVPRTLTLKARAFRSDLAPSKVTSANYKMWTASPEFAGITYGEQSLWITNGAPISLSSKTPGAQIYYSVDGGAPVLYTEPFRGAQSFITANAVRDGYEPSAAVQVLLRLFYTPPPTVVTELEHTTGTKHVRIATEIAAEIHFTVDGLEPTVDSPIYKDVLIIPANTTLKARAWAPNYAASVTVTMQYGSDSRESTVVTLFAGTREGGFQDGPASIAKFNHPVALSFDAVGDLLVADTFNNRIRKVSKSGMVSTVARDTEFARPTGITVDHAGNIWICETDPNRLRFIKPSGEVVSYKYNFWFDFTASDSFWQLEALSDGSVMTGLGLVGKVIAAENSEPMWTGLFGQTGPGLVGLGVTASGTFFAVSAGERSRTSSIFRISFFADEFYAGGTPGFADGPLASARYFRPLDLAGAPDGSMIVSDLSRIRRISASGNVTTVAGFGGVGYRNGPGSLALFNQLAGLAVHANGTIYVADSKNNCIRKIASDVDHDLIPDSEEQSPFALGVDDRQLDSDGDGQSNSSEYIAGTDPTSPASVLRILTVRRLSDGDFELTWQSVPGKSHTIERSSNMRDWEAMSTISTTGVAVVTNPTAVQLFFRVTLVD